MPTRARPKADLPDEENPEWSADDFRRARPALDAIAEHFGPVAAEALRQGRGRPPNPDRKVNQTLRLDPDVLAAWRRTGPGWQSRINDVLRANMPGPDSAAD
jgi:uncharacterized protein (DUF4415 family)